MKEVWKDVVGYEGRYKISSCGKVYSVERTVRFGTTKRVVGGKMMTQKPDVNGYLTVCLNDGNGDKRPKKVHRLLAIAFIPNPNNYPCVNHKDEDKTNNKLENLEWCTVKYNNNYGTHQQRSSSSRMNHPKRSIPVMCVETRTIYPSMREAERQTGIDQSQIWHCVKDQRRTAMGLHWCYAEGE